MSQPLPARRRSRWPLVLAVLVTVVVVVSGAIMWWFSAGSEAWARHRWNPPESDYLPSMRANPVAGWTADIATLGLPPGSSITAGDDPQGPIIRTGSSRAYLIASSPGPTPQWWLTGVDAADGRRLFAPVALNMTTRAPSCFINGASVVCIADDYDRATAWVIDRQTGQLTYTGPTDVRLTSWEKRSARQAGDYLVAVTEKQGIYGVGPQAETTWFVPGAGVVAEHNSDVAFQGTGREDGVTLFSLADGQVLDPQFPDKTELLNTAFFSGGFAQQFAEKPGHDFVQFFDTAGKLTINKRFDGKLGGTTGNLIGIADSDSYGIYTLQGDKLLDLAGGRIQLIGTTLWVSEKDKVTQSTAFRPYDMRTGDKGEPCEFDLSTGYLGSDGTVAVRAPVNPKSDLLADAWDLSTCERVWSIPRNGPLGRVTRLGDTLVRLSDDGTELYSLVAP
ncbi:hypothetical protein MFORT_16991 [Mycolicibacterium fortuitum subsp. fortuitum DSM 46621 = ATCC 6841 = JCM 6387]|uniref:Uncharacterized protein n=1 Tax=Mycolicibacterium fortuitum subsp. fortuitum DSM 46621 = ATCC 6841 = JCM 6387 TaxID=1214102 RepID=K0VD70_MYCFO|nr:hypothetical protein MFORT_16991 [Mycolicibacterium fortuitum subsp. fortuitum DSM 46621 = ATCC 6841 = JCM 6387]BDE01816.1 hypothetical protein MFTT_59090 [Mycolicibacterium fortuitum subsp. fortuitum]CRL57637.1 hypothetical protein CPGR_04974 [Mycolicibacterium fortuitum subsp. fortuitum DSM 46621 = ATCC 6841 = JCM 6387]CRL70390.1 hypothetical protein CPGR_00446 [Mycolicibacter nonchromogenicus]